tara:strand:+ start:814 stop:2265 length:1452 start_codon:yes stop_codon:yes gene_type:complete
MQLNELVKEISFNGETKKCEITSITYDSRKVKEGTLFVAIAGFNVDGHDYIDQAIKKGAAAILANGRSPKTTSIPIIQVKNPRIALSQIAAQFYGNPSKSLQVFGITGTNGKTSITHILHHIIQESGVDCGTMGTLGFKTPTGMVSTGFTTPESIEVHQMLKTLKLAKINNVIMEVSSHALELHRVENVDIDIAIFTNLTPEHLDFHGNMENYFNSKLKLFTNLDKSKTAIINIDDSYSKRICNASSCKILTYGMNSKADIYTTEFRTSINGIRAMLKYKSKLIKINSKLIGIHNMYNILAACAAGLTIGIDSKKIEKALQDLPAIPGRLEQIFTNLPGTIFIDYAHTPDAFEKVFTTINNLKADRRIITIFGCGGNRDSNKRKDMARISEQYSDYIYITTDNPRTESINEINKHIVQGFKNSNYNIINDRKDAIQNALKNMDEKTILLILGKGRENYQEIGTEKVPHDDIRIIKDFQNESKN